MGIVLITGLLGTKASYAQPSIRGLGGHHGSLPPPPVQQLPTGNRTVPLFIVLDSAPPPPGHLFTTLEGKFESDLLRIVSQIEFDGSIAANLARHRIDSAKLGNVARAHVDSAGRVYVLIAMTTGHLASELKALIEGIGGKAELGDEKTPFVQAWLSPLKLRLIAASPIVAQLRTIQAPGHNTGSVLAVGATESRADVATAVFGATGAGVKVGVMSNDFGSTTGDLTNSVATGNINSTYLIVSDPDVNFSDHEGLAMAEIVQDIAPKAQICFATSDSGGDLGMRVNMFKLANAGCKVITDDAVIYDDPVFSDGILAQAIDSLAKLGVVYTSAAGNQAAGNFLGVFKNMAGTGKFAGKSVCDFGGENFIYRITEINPDNFFNIVYLTLQWDDPFFASSNDYDLYLVSLTDTSQINSSTTSQTGVGSSPLEKISINLPGTYNNQLGVVIVRKSVSGSDPNATARLKLTGYIQGDAYQVFGSPNGSLFGHAAAAGCLAAGAVDGKIDDYFPPSYDSIESYSCQGPTAIINVQSNPRTVNSVRSKPDLVSFDGVNTSLSSFAPFYGTSAATPHVAGIAALLIQMFPNLTSAQARAALIAGCMDFGPAGYDSAYGNGRLDAFRVLSLANSGNNASSAFTSPLLQFTGGNSVSSTLALTSPCAATTVDSVFLSATIDCNTDFGDFVCSLQGPDGTSRVLLNRPPTNAGTSTGMNPNFVLADAATSPIETVSSNGQFVLGYYVPDSLVSTSNGFHGKSLAGNWTLTVQDAVRGTDIATLRDWGIYAKADKRLALTANPPYIWSSDHSLKNITVTPTVVNGCAPTVTLTSLTSSEPDAGTGTGDLPNDIQNYTLGTADYTFSLRAETAPHDTGRVYTATYTMTDVGGFSQTYTVNIPVLPTLGHASSSPSMSSGGNSLSMPFPNPVLTTTQISYTLASSDHVDLKIFDLRGKWQKNLDYGLKPAGTQTVTWNGTRANGTLLPDGEYVYQLNTSSGSLAGIVTLSH